MAVRVTPGRFDVHAHLLPGVDDGCPSVDESVTCARHLVDSGYRHVFCTPHVWPGFPENTWANIRRWTADLQARFEAAGLPVQLFPGGEINIQAMWPALARWDRSEIPTFGADGNHVLMDFWADRLPPEFEPAVRHFQSLGLTVVVAHPERIGAFQEDPTLAQRLAEMGVVFQGNLQCFAEAPDAPARRLVERFAAEGRYFLLATDLHRLETLRPRLDGLRAAIDLLGYEAVDELTIHNPWRLLPGAGASPEQRDVVSSDEFSTTQG